MESRVDANFIWLIPLVFRKVSSSPDRLYGHSLAVRVKNLAAQEPAAEREGTAESIPGFEIFGQK